jgi:riboflavin synthase
VKGLTKEAGALFTGIITDLGRVRSLERRGDLRLAIETRLPLEDVPIGASMACSGPCLTVVDKVAGCFMVDVSAETQSRTTLGGWQEGEAVNLERPVRLGDELGGHLVSGHVDGTAEVLSRTPEGDSFRFRFRAPDALTQFIAVKGSVALDGVSLTINEVEGSVFGVNIIPHTQRVTTFGQLKAGDRVNLEIDQVARYLARLIGRS